MNHSRRNQDLGGMNELFASDSQNGSWLNAESRLPKAFLRAPLISPGVRSEMSPPRRSRPEPVACEEVSILTSSRITVVQKRRLADASRKTRNQAARQAEKDS